MEKKLIGVQDAFAIEYSFNDSSRETELGMYLDGNNILAFELDGTTHTTYWNLDELALWLRKFVDSMDEDPFPVEVEGEFAAEKDSVARDYDPDDADVDEYFDKLYDWGCRHRWHVAAGGAILADVYFQLVGDEVEISWNNSDLEGPAVFATLSGGARVSREVFAEVINGFLREYAVHWFN